MDSKVAEEQVLRLIATCFGDETKVEEGFPIGIVNLTGVVKRGKRREAFVQVHTSSSTMRSIASGMRSRWQIGFAAILPGGRFVRRRGDILVERGQGGKIDCRLAFFRAGHGYIKLSNQQGAAAYSSVPVLRLGRTDSFWARKGQATS